MGRLRPALFSKDMEKELTPQQKAAIEYNRRLRTRRFNVPEELRGKTSIEVMELPEFETILTACIKEQVETRTKVLETIAELKKQGKKVGENRPMIDRVMELGLLDDPGEFAIAFLDVEDKRSKYPSEIRMYIHQLGMKAYNATVEKFICKANPDMAELLKRAMSNTKN